jgi:succinoglycan biosynthesis transport protein ExoP
MNSSRQLAAVWRARWLLLLFAAVVAGAAYWVSGRQATYYESTAVARVVLGQQALGWYTSPEQQLNSSNIYAEYARLQAVRDDAISHADLRDGSAERGDLSAQPREQPLGIELRARAASAQDAERLANSYAAAFDEYVFRVQGERRSRQLAGIAERRRQLQSRAPKAEGDELNIINGEIARLGNEVQGELRRPLDQVIVVQPAAVPFGRAWPLPWRDAPLAAILALVGGTAAVALRSRRRYRSPEEASERLGLPILGAVPEAAEDDPRNDEAMRTVGTRLEALEGEFRAVVLVTSAESGAGRTLVTSELARSLARGGARVAAVDADLHAPRLHDHLGVELGHGLTDISRRRSADDEPPVQASPRFDGHDTRGCLDVVSAGVLHSGAGEFLSSETFTDTIEALKQRYDYVLVDSPAMADAGDATVIAGHATVVVFVVHSWRTRPGAAADAVAALTALGRRPAGIVYNAAPDDQVLQTSGGGLRRRELAGYRS